MADFPTDTRAYMLVAAVALIDAEGRVLLQRRRAERAHGGLWEFPGGKLEPGEAAEVAARREIAEELGLELAGAVLEPLGFAADDGLESARSILMLLYGCRGWQGAPQCLDAAEIGWFAPAEMADLAMPPLDVPLVRAVENFLSRGGDKALAKPKFRP